MSAVNVIAEVGMTHDGSLGHAIRMAEVAAECGVDAVKFQLHDAEAETTRDAPSPPYFKHETRWEYFERTAFTDEQWGTLKRRARPPASSSSARRSRLEAVERLERIGVARYKIGSGEVTNLELVRAAAATGKPVLLTSGMSSWAELDAAVAAAGDQVTVLQCTSQYPTPPERVGLNVLAELRERYGKPVGFSDHTLGNYAAFAAVTLGATVVEKHFTLSRDLYGADARFATEPLEFEELVDGIRELETMLANPVDKDDLEPYGEMKQVFEKSVVTTQEIPAGADDLARDGRGQEARHRDPRAHAPRGASAERRARHRRRHRAHRGPARVRKVCVVVGSRANYSSIKSAMRAVEEHPDLELQLVVGASALLDRYGSVVDLIERDGFEADERVFMLIEGETPATMAKSTGLGLLELPTAFERLKPDVVVTVGDRFETMATALAAAYMNIPLAHTMGGEVSGNIDESIRHAVTKFAHVHFPASQGAAERIVKMGEEPESVHLVGCPRMDLVAEVLARRRRRAAASSSTTGVGGRVQPRRAVPARLAAPGDDRVRRGQGADRRDAGGAAGRRHAGDRALAERRRRLRGHRARHAEVPRAQRRLERALLQEPADERLHQADGADRVRSSATRRPRSARARSSARRR